MTTILKWLEWESVSGYTTCNEIQTMYIIYDFHTWKIIERDYFNFWIKIN